MLAVESLHDLIAFRFKPNRDLIAVTVSWTLVTASLWIATNVIGGDNGIPYFLVYAILTAAICGVGLPLIWTVFVTKRPVSALGVTTKFLGASLVIQLVLTAAQYAMTLAKIELPAVQELLPLIALILCIGFFEVVFWRGWVFSRLEEAFGFLPALILGSALYAVYHIGYGMTWSQMGTLFWVGVVYTCVFRLTRNVFVLWPVLQPVGQLFTLSKDGLTLPFMATVGFAEVLIVMLVAVFLAQRYWKKHYSAASGVSLATEGRQMQAIPDREES